MTDRAWVFERTQIGVETVKGTNVPANKLLQATMIRPSVNAETVEFAPSGFKYETVVVNGKEWTVLAVEGVGAYTDPVYLFSAIFGDAIITTPDPVGAPSARQWQWTPDSDGPDNPNTFSVEYGSSVRAEECSYAFLQTMGIRFTRANIGVTGQMLAQLTQDGITLTGSPTPIALVPIIPDEIDIFLDDTAVGIGTTKLLRAMEANWQLNDKYGIFWPMNSANTSFAGHIETKPQGTVSLLLGADAAGMALLADMRAGATKFLRIQATGSNLGGIVNHLLQLDCAVKIRTPNQKQNTEGLTTIPWDLRIVHDSGWDKAMQITMVNELTAL